MSAKGYAMDSGMPLAKINVIGLLSSRSEV
jgi:hypothetical protein